MKLLTYNMFHFVCDYHVTHHFSDDELGKIWILFR